MAGGDFTGSSGASKKEADQQAQHTGKPAEKLSDKVPYEVKEEELKPVSKVKVTEPKEKGGKKTKTVEEEATVVLHLNQAAMLSLQCLNAHNETVVPTARPVWTAEPEGIVNISSTTGDTTVVKVSAIKTGNAVVKATLDSTNCVLVTTIKIDVQDAVSNEAVSTKITATVTPV